MKYLYTRVKENDEVLIPDDLQVKIFTPTIGGGLLLAGERRCFKDMAVRALFQLLTCGKARIYYLRQNDKLVHTSYVIPKCYKFSYLGKEDYQIGPCYTYLEYRGKGYYPLMLRHICKSEGSEKTVFYMTVDENNIASIKGIEKAGLIRRGSIRVTKLTKRYVLENKKKG